MKVLLCEDVEKLGWYGDVVEVNESYARNFLMPQRLATVPTEHKIKAMAEEKAKRTVKRNLDEERMQKAAAAVEGAEVVLAAKANDQGHLFGSITANQIADNLRQQGFEVVDKVVHIDEHIKEVGQYSVKLIFTANVTAKVKVTIVPEGSGGEKADGSEEGKTTE